MDFAALKKGGSRLVPNKKYDYDVFISYPHHYGEWVTEIFFKLFADSLCEALGDEPKIFIDKYSIDVGDDLQSRLQQGLARAKVFVPILGARYFHSVWCVAECAAILHREPRQKVGTVDSPSTFIFPVRLDDGDHTPNLLKGFIYLDCLDFNDTNEAFKSSGSFNKLKANIKKEAAIPVAAQIRNISHRDPTWECTTYLKQAYDKYKDLLLENFSVEHRKKFPPADSFLKSGHDDNLKNTEKIPVPRP